MSRPARKRNVLPFKRPTPPGGSIRMVFPACSRPTVLTLELMVAGPLPHVIVERDGKPARIKWLGRDGDAAPKIVPLAGW